MLAAYQRLIQTQAAFQPGELVIWKPGLKNKRLPGLFVVVEVLDQPIIDPEKSAGSTYFREPLDIKVATFDKDGDLIEVHLDSRRLEPYIEPETPAADESAETTTD